MKLTTLFLLLVHLLTICGNDLHIEELHTHNECGTELINEEPSSPLLLSTLDGSFYAVDQRTGEILWTFKQEAVVKVPPIDRSVMPLFLPDPKDGSLYVMNTGNHYDLKKLQFTIQQLVSASPCRSTDGIFYTGKKIDDWFAIDWRTGKVEKLSDLDKHNKTCSLEYSNSIFLGRTEYNLMMRDLNRGDKHWNITYYNYAVNALPMEKRNYPYGYFSGSDSGKFAVASSAGAVLWESDFGSPVVGVYVRDGDSLLSVLFTTVDDKSMYLLSSPRNIPFFSTLYIGEHGHGLYATPSISTMNSRLLLLNGPSATIFTPPMSLHTDSSGIEEQALSLTGHYKIPEYGVTRLLITGRSDPIIQVNGNASDFRNTLKKNIAIQTDKSFVDYDDDDDNNEKKKVQNIIEVTVNNSMTDSGNTLLMRCIHYISTQENISLKASMIGLLVIMSFMFIYLKNQMHELKHSSNNSSSQNGVGNTDGSITAIAEELTDGSIRVGKIQFRPELVLGKGCEGTFVFRGEFDNRPVAVKRLLPECFVVADREVGLLRESDQHPNVVRYFCMEQDKQFRYIALELCQTTLHEYTEKGVLNELITPAEILYQATAGLEHLHTLQIVHRDIKPHNVLLSMPCKQSNKVRVLISDFGLCKKLQSGRHSFSRRSGITGTEGWIAPEIIHGKERTMTAVDIFSLGCVFYYVLSKGKHPFGDSLRRQANILGGDYKVTSLLDDPYGLWEHLIIKMITKNPHERPSAPVVKCHPAFWDKRTVLSFLQDVSDRIEKEDLSSSVLLQLEIGNSWVLKNGDWRLTIEPEIAQDLRKHRNYRGDSLRDLLRALRNKKHHYRELSQPIRDILGPIPDGFVNYWITHFPLLLLHTWLTMQCIKYEELFSKYYSELYTFPRSTNNTDVPNWITEYVSKQQREQIITENNNGNASPTKSVNNKRKYGLPKNGVSDKDFNWRNFNNRAIRDVVVSSSRPSYVAHRTDVATDVIHETYDEDIIVNTNNDQNHNGDDNDNHLDGDQAEDGDDTEVDNDVIRLVRSPNEVDDRFLDKPVDKLMNGNSQDADGNVNESDNLYIFQNKSNRMSNSRYSNVVRHRSRHKPKRKQLLSSFTSFQAKENNHS